MLLRAVRLAVKPVLLGSLFGVPNCNKAGGRSTMVFLVLQVAGRGEVEAFRQVL